MFSTSCCACAHKTAEIIRLFILQLALLLTTFFVVQDAVALQNSSVKALFEQSVLLFQKGDYGSAKQLLLTAMDKGASTPHLSKIYLMLSAVNEKMGDLHREHYYAQKLVRQFPDSRYRDAAEFALARVCYRRGEPLQSLVHLLTIIDRNRQAALVETAKMTGTRIVALGLFETGLEGYLGDFQRAGSRNWLIYWLAKQEYGLGHRSQGDLWLQRLQMNAPEVRLQRLLQELKSNSTTENLYTLRIGIVLPLSGFEGENGMEFLRGVALALQDHPQGIELVIKDTQSNLKQGLLAMQELLDSRIDLIIGELAGDRSAAMAALAAARNIPMLVPASSDNGIAALGSGILQMTSDLETRGAALAEYAYHTLGLRTFVSLAPADDYGQAMSDAFANAIDRLGGTIVAQQWYYPGTKDVSRQFTAIRESASQFAPRDSVIDRDFMAGARLARETLPEYTYAQPSRRAITPETEDEDLPRIGSIDGFFMPTYAEDISIVAPQFSLAHIQAVPLGGDDWLHGDMLKSQRRYLDGAVFCAGSFADETSMEYIQFINRFRLSTGTSAGPLALAGYDVTHVVTKALNSGRSSAADVMNYISKIQNHSGIGSTFSFTPGKRVNQDVAILQYKGGGISRLHD